MRSSWMAGTLFHIAGQRRSARRIAKWFTAASEGDRARIVVRIQRRSGKRLRRRPPMSRCSHRKRDAAEGRVGHPGASSPGRRASFTRAASDRERVRGGQRAAGRRRRGWSVWSSARSTTPSTSTSTSESSQWPCICRDALAIASRVAGLSAPVAGVTPQLDDEQRLLADLAWSRRHGFGAKLCIHPRQVAPIHAALSASAEAVDLARRVLAAEAASPGAAQLDG